MRAKTKPPHQPDQTAASGQTPAPGERATGKTYFWWALILLFGILIGAGGMFVTMRRMIVRQPRVLHLLRDGAEGQVAQLITRELSRELTLRGEQEEQIRNLLTKHLRQIRSVQNHFRPKLRRQIDRFRDEINPILDAPQQERWRKKIESIKDAYFPPISQDNTASPEQLMELKRSLFAEDDFPEVPTTR